MANCAYCNSENANTADHVPPKGLFPKPRPSDLITVPSCLSCNGEASSDEEYFQRVLLFGPAGLTEPGQRLWETTARRGFAKNAGMAKRFRNALRQVNVRSRAGLHLGEATGLKLEHETIERVINKTIRGLYCFEFTEVLDPRAVVQSQPLDTQQRVDEVERIARACGQGSRSWPEFQYRFGRAPERPTGSAWFLRFYERTLFWGISSLPEDWSRVRDARSQN